MTASIKRTATNSVYKDLSCTWTWLCGIQKLFPRLSSATLNVTLNYPLKSAGNGFQESIMKHAYSPYTWIWLVYTPTPAVDLLPSPYIWKGIFQLPLYSFETYICCFNYNKSNRFSSFFKQFKCSQFPPFHLYPSPAPLCFWKLPFEWVLLSLLVHIIECSNCWG